MATNMSSNDVVASKMINACWKKQCVDTGSIWGNFKNQVLVFIHTPIKDHKDHKDCFKFTCHQMMDRFSPKSSGFVADDSMELPFDRDLF